ncbi:nucleoredoxin-like [Ylistrum balloti]|uniref:nucleoredoxin-like n=1 Tax=Ylistrum balloti TaxID=509963 RepID=UPI0029059411|nr:nucleoredoxin-like [Ylistrum balloti]
MAKVLEGLLGTHVIRGHGDKAEKVSVSSLSERNSVVGLYFSAQWCSPCKSFTPILLDFYESWKLKNEDVKFEIVFVSWDKDEVRYTDFFSSMPWLALPFDPDNLNKKSKLLKKVRVPGIPKLVLLDGETGKTITTDGYTRLTDDPKGLEFPWRKKKFTEVISGKLINNRKEECDALEQLKGKFVGIYFSAHWCPPCRAFTPELIKRYDQLESDGKHIEVVFVSSDRSEESFSSYLETMPWWAIPFGDSRTEQLKDIFGVDGIPTFVILDGAGDVVTLNGRTAVNLDREGREFPWYSKPLNPLKELEAVALNERPSLVLFTEGEDADIEMSKEVLESLAREEHQKGEDQELYFFYGTENECCDNVRDFANLEDRCPLLVIFDLPDQKVYLSPETVITKEVATDFVSRYFAGTLEATSLS